MYNLWDNGCESYVYKPCVAHGKGMVYMSPIVTPQSIENTEMIRTQGLIIAPGQDRNIKKLETIRKNKIRKHTKRNQMETKKMYIKR